MGVAVMFDLRPRRIGVNGFSACRCAICSANCCLNSFPESWVSMVNNEEVKIGVFGRGGKFESKVPRE
jgi:hypothetical protein